LLALKPALMPSFGLTVQIYQLSIFLTRSILLCKCTEFRSLHTLCRPEIFSPSETPRIKVMNNMDKARAALAALPRCTASHGSLGFSAKTRTLEQVVNVVSIGAHQLATHPLTDD
jgi:hypothetical protein